MEKGGPAPGGRWERAKTYLTWKRFVRGCKRAMAMVGGGVVLGLGVWLSYRGNDGWAVAAMVIAGIYTMAWAGLGYAPTLRSPKGEWGLAERVEDLVKEASEARARGDLEAAEGKLSEAAALVHQDGTKNKLVISLEELERGDLTTEPTAESHRQYELAVKNLGKQQLVWTVDPKPRIEFPNGFSDWQILHAEAKPGPVLDKASEAPFRRRRTRSASACTSTGSNLMPWPGSSLR